ncbi:MAG: hypothetical protein JWO36_169 [Myxococcales bacterium]|nr:hypothetical protein [Myxococcales bacterium]
MTVRGVGDIGGTCRDADAHQFVASYHGTADIDSDGKLDVPIFPNQPALETPGGCKIRSLDVDQITSAEIGAVMTPTDEACGHACADDVCRASCETSAVTIAAHGYLDFQILIDLDQDQLETGDFGELHVSMVFDAPIDAAGRQIVAP